MRPLAIVGHTAPEALALALADKDAALEALAAGELAAVEELGRGAVVARDEGLAVDEGAAHAAVANAAVASVTKPVRAPTLNPEKRKDMRELLHG